MSRPALKRTPPPGAEPVSGGCAWCGQRPAYRALIEPAQYEGLRLVHAAKHASCCVPCAAWLRLDLAGHRPVAEQIKLRKIIAAERRADRRAAMQAAQQSLF